MKMFTTYKRNNPDTINGESITVTTVYSSYNEKEIDELENQLRNSIGSGLIGNINTEGRKENEC